MVMQELLTRFFDAYLVKRDLESTLSVLSDAIVSLGTGAQEVALNKEELRALMVSEFESIPNGFQYAFGRFHEYRYSADLWGAYCEVQTTMTDENGMELTLKTRLTATAARLDGTVKIINLHMSTPSDQQDGEEFFPIKYGRQAVGKLDATSSKKLVEIMMSMLPGGIMGGYLEEGFPLYIINDTMLEYLGYTYDELVEETGEYMQKIIDPQDWERVERTIYDSINKTGEYNVRYRVIRKDGTRIWVDDKGHEITTEDGRKAMISVMLDISEGVRQQERLEKEVVEDGLTGILNRKGAFQRVEEYVSHHQPGALFILDIDQFKQLNDNYGHQNGDEVLVQLANVMKRHSREEDVVARVGGDEFLLFLPGCVSENVIKDRADHICSEFREYGKAYPKVDLSVSIGITLFEGSGDFDSLFKKADDLLYQVKRNGKDGFLFDGSKS